MTGWVSQAVQLDAAMARVLPIMLATRVVPDMEEVQTAHLAAHRQAAGAAPVDAQYYRLVVRSYTLAPSRSAITV